MEYRGRPSGACLACRQRRIKCSKQEPACMQCVRLCIACPGYRDVNKLAIRDETDKVVWKAESSYRAKESKMLALPSATLSEDGSTHPAYFSYGAPWKEITTGPADRTSLRMVQPSIQPMIEDVAFTHFMTTYVPGSHFDYLGPMCTIGVPSTALSSSMRAASFALLSQQTGEPSMAMKARKHYADALAITNEALRDHSTALNDQTLIAVLLLSLFEAVAWTEIHTPQSWDTHTRGALSLVSLRGRAQLDTDLGRKLLLQVASIVAIEKLKQKSAFPRQLTDLILLARGQSDDASSVDLMLLLTQVIDAVSSLNDGREDVGRGIQRLIQLDHKCEAFTTILPSGWHYESLELQELHPAVCGSIVHRYSSHMISRRWNSLRMIRVYLNEVLHSMLIASSPHFTSVEESSSSVPNPAILLDPTEADKTIEHDVSDLLLYCTSNLVILARDICASMPQFTHPALFGDPDAGVPTKAFAASLLWPLSTVSRSQFASEEMRQYALETMQDLAREFATVHVGKVTGTNVGNDALDNGLHMLYTS